MNYSKPNTADAKTIPPQLPFPMFQAMPMELFQPVFNAMSFWTYWSQHNAAANAEMRKEWFKFIQHRLEQDASIASKLCACKSPDEYWSTYAGFWQQCSDDYRKQMTEFARIYSQAVSENTQAIQEAARKSARDRWCEANPTKN